MIIADNISISMIRSGKGDCIHLRFVGDSGKAHNIIIDSGPTATAGAFRSLISSICSVGESLDMLIITHYDDDHIGGILKTGDPGFNKIAFNAYIGEPELPELSARQNQRLFHILPSAKVCSPLLAGDILELDGGRIVVYAPTEKMLSAAKKKMKEADANLAGISDWNQSLDELMISEYSAVDTSVSNQASIVFTFELGNKRFLFCGDAWPENIPGGHYDMVKLPHHGSIRNISEEWLLKLETDSFLICADGTKHPNKQTIAKLIRRFGRITIYSNYSWWMNGFLIGDDKKFIQNGQLSFALI